MNDYVGNMEGGVVFVAPKPFVLLGWPEEKDAKTFDTEKEARQFIASAKLRDPYVMYAALYGFSDNKWNRL